MVDYNPGVRERALKMSATSKAVAKPLPTPVGKSSNPNNTSKSLRSPSGMNILTVNPITNKAVTPPVTSPSPQKASPLNSWYSKLDNSLRGYLPGGVSPAESKVIRTNTAVVDTSNLNQATAKLREAQLTGIKQEQSFANAKDYNTDSWYEKWGLFQTDQEEQYKKLRDQQSYLEQFNAQIPSVLAAKQQYDTTLQANPGLLSELSASTGTESFGSSFGKSLGTWGVLAIAAVAAIFILKNNGGKK